MFDNISKALSEGYKCTTAWWFSIDLLRRYLLLILLASFPGRTVSGMAILSCSYRGFRFKCHFISYIPHPRFAGYFHICACSCMCGPGLHSTIHHSVAQLHRNGPPVLLCHHSSRQLHPKHPVPSHNTPLSLHSNRQRSPAGQLRYTHVDFHNIVLYPFGAGRNHVGLAPSTAHLQVHVCVAPMLAIGHCVDHALGYPLFNRQYRLDMIYYVSTPPPPPPPPPPPGQTSKCPGPLDKLLFHSTPRTH